MKELPEWYKAAYWSINGFALGLAVGAALIFFA